MFNLVENARNSIEKGKFKDFREEFKKNYNKNKNT
jgi:queuine/archaeosine tRNA-ribosyltransferase